jgi:formate dehydrogenase subunit gamma
VSHLLERYANRTRMIHWAVALLFFCAGLSGLTLFHPSLYPLSLLFGGGPWTRIVHPYLGVLMVFAFVLLFSLVWRENAWNRRDVDWLRAAPRLIATGDENGMPPSGKYNAGQKGVFWCFCLSLVLLFLTGFVFWQPLFAGHFPIPWRRIAVVVHAAAAVMLILSAIAHVYAAIWVKDTMRAMTRGTVTESWAQHNHARWYAEMRKPVRPERAAADEK